MDTLVEKLQKANWAYHNDTPIMTDDEYDRGLEELRRISPSHPFLSLIGAPVSKGVILPFIMGSQEKARTAEDMSRWMKRQSSKHFIGMDKLDGLSALYTGKRLYLRGDGVKGVDISSLIPVLGLSRLTTQCAVRGELILSKAATPQGSIGRSLVNGWVHRSLDGVIAPELRSCRFVAYQVLSMKAKRSAQMAWLKENGFDVPWFMVWPSAAIIESQLKTHLMERRITGEYPIDGLVIAADGIPVSVGGGEARNPPDSIAFKMSLEDQKAETTVVGIEWNMNRQQVWFPRIQIEPVEIGGATIQWLSGHNAKMIDENGLGPGAKIVIRRSGDVIPTLDSVTEATTAQMPPVGTWQWDQNRVHAIATSSTEISPTQGLLHALQTLGVEGIGPGLVKKIVDGGFTSMLKVWNASEKELASCIGAGRAPTFIKALRASLAAASISNLLIASNILPRGVGDRKLRAVFDKESDPKKWSMSLYPIEGWSEDSFQELLHKIPAVLEWILISFPCAVIPVKEHTRASLDKSKTSSKFVVFTGVRDKVLEGKLSAAGWSMEDSVSKKTNVLVVPENAKETAKLKKARDLGIQILTLAAFQKTLG